MNWRAKPPVSYLAIIQLIVSGKNHTEASRADGLDPSFPGDSEGNKRLVFTTSTTTETGLTVTCQLDSNAYQKGIKISDEEKASLNVKPASFHGEWNYTIAPRRPDG
jgi:hypothetical protein